MTARASWYLAAVATACRHARMGMRLHIRTRSLDFKRRARYHIAKNSHTQPTPLRCERYFHAARRE
eukprot:11195160-Lingulodinium_polyedra.AAC.1